MNCNYECHQIGGPWIAENPDCPVHGREAIRLAEIREREEAEAQTEREEMLSRMADMESRLKALENLQMPRLRSRGHKVLTYTKPLTDKS